MPLTWLDYFCVLTCPFICALQLVSASSLAGLFLCPNLSVHLCSLGSECTLWVRLFLCPNLSICLCSLESEYLPSWIFSVF